MENIKEFSELMFENIGSKIKKLAVILCWIGIIASVITSVILFFIGIAEEAFFGWIGVLVLIGGSLVSWIGSFTLYGFGELIEKTTEISENTNNKQSNLITENTKNKLSNQKSEAYYPVQKEWKCSCGRINAYYCGTCACGKRKNEV